MPEALCNINVRQPQCTASVGAERPAPTLPRRRSLRVLQISTADRLGGAEQVAWNLFDALRDRGLASSLAVGFKRTDDPDVLEIRHDLASKSWRRFWWTLHRRSQRFYGRFPGSKQLSRIAHDLAAPQGRRDRRLGIEDFNYPGVWRLLSSLQGLDIVHCHNLHGRYFDLRALPKLCAAKPVVLTLHDAWLLAGHCAHNMNCERWRTGCGQCPDLSIYRAIRRDSTAENWRRKRNILARCRLYVATPCQWLMNQVRQSILAPAIVESRVIPNGIDQSIFQPGDKRRARHALGIEHTASLLLFSAQGIRRNRFKDYDTLQAAIGRLGAKDGPFRIILLAMGEAGASAEMGRTTIHFVPRIDDPRTVALHYQAADLYVHAAKADTFPTSILEALSCGTPVAATSVGGIPEQIRPWPSTHATGVLTPSGDPCAMADAIQHLLLSDGLRRKLGENAARDAICRFRLEQQVDAYLQWYRTILARRRLPTRRA